MNFERLNVWVRSKDLSVAIYRQLSDLRDWGFKDQITRSGLSVPSNIAEGMVRASAKEKFRFLNIAQSSCAELRTQVYIGRDIGFIPADVAQYWIDETLEISAMITGLVKSLK